MNLLLRFDRAQLAIADAAAAWLCDHLELSLRTVVRLALAGMLLSQMLAQIATEGRVEIITLLFGAFLVVMFESNARRYRMAPELQRAITLANRARPFSVFVRLAIWPWTAYSVVMNLSSRALPLELASDVSFVVLVFASHALPPIQPPRRWRETKVTTGLQPATARFGVRS